MHKEIMKKNLTQGISRGSAYRQEAFTLIELLVVVAIMGLLTSVVMFSVTSAREKKYDAKRTQDVRQLEIAIELRLRENTQIPNVSIASIDVSEKIAAGKTIPTLGDAISYVTMAPRVAEADTDMYAKSGKFYKDLFTNGFFRSGTPMPQDPQCANPTAAIPDPDTCYRAYYDQATNVIVIATTLRTKKHTPAPGGFQAHVQYGIAMGSGVNISTTLVTSCQNIGFPAYSTLYSAATDPALSCVYADGVSSVIQGISNGKNIVGGSGSTGSI